MITGNIGQISSHFKFTFEKQVTKMFGTGQVVLRIDDENQMVATCGHNCYMYKYDKDRGKWEPQFPQ